MAKGTKKTTRSKTRKEALLKPALIVSKDTISDNRFYIERLMVGLADKSIPLSIVCPYNSDISDIAVASAEVIHYPILNLPFLANRQKLAMLEKLKKFDPSLLHCLSPAEMSFAEWISRRLDLPYLLNIDSLKSPWQRLPKKTRHVTGIIVSTETIADNLTSLRPKLSDFIVKVNPGTFVWEECTCFCQSNRCPSMIVSHPFNRKDEFEKLFAAFRHLAIDGYDFMVALIGAGRTERQIRQLIGDLGLSPRVVIVPVMQPPLLTLSAGDIFIQPQPVNSFNTLLLEAMGMGLAIAGCKGGVDDLLINNKTATVFDPEDELSIYSCLRQLLDKKELTRNLASDAQEYLRENHTVSSMIDNILKIYEDAQSGFTSPQSSRP